MELLYYTLYILPGWHITPASWPWWQVPVSAVCEQSIKSASFPEQYVFVRNMSPVPLPK